MARLARAVAIGIPHHVTQRGNGREFVLAREEDRRVYLQLLEEHAGLNGLTVLGYCVMSNHVHLVAVPQGAESMGRALKHAHGRYAAWWNAANRSCGHVWQGRFFSCALDEVHLWAALRYVELNPVRAGMVQKAEDWAWSSAAAHCATGTKPSWLEMSHWEKRWGTEGWISYLRSKEDAITLEAIRRCTHTGRPLGADPFVANMEEKLGRPLAPRKGGRPRREAATV